MIGNKTLFKAVGASLLAASGACHAVTCETLKLEIEQKIRLAGVLSFSLVVVNVGDAVAGQVVGTCANASKRIVYAQSRLPTQMQPGTQPGTVPGTRPPPILTECKPGFTGANCERRIAPPLPRAASAPTSAASR